jgi:hypothetical protein
MAREILRAEIGFRLRDRIGDAPAVQAAHKRLSKQVARNLIGGSVEERRTEGASHVERFPVSARLEMHHEHAIKHQVARVMKLARERGMTLATVESCTAGLLAHMLSEGEAASDNHQRPQRGMPAS